LHRVGATALYGASRRRAACRVPAWRWRSLARVDAAGALARRRCWAVPGQRDGRRALL